MSVTRAAFRRRLGLRTGQPFFRKFGTAARTASASGSTTTLVDTVLLKEGDDYWNGSYIYLPATDEAREVSDFANATSTLTWLAAVAGSTGATTAYELWSHFTPLEVHEALNYALASAWPYFFLQANNETKCIEDGAGLVYTLPTTNTIRRLAQVYIIAYSSVTGSITTTGGDGTDVQNSAASFTSADVGKWIAIYKGGGAANGEIKQISSVTSGTQVVTGEFSAAPASGAKYRMLDKTDTSPGIIMINDWILDRPQFPTEMWLGSHPGGYEGFPIKYVYEYEHPPLTTEAGSTSCPEEFLFNATTAYLYYLKLSSSPATEAPTWESLYKASTQAAQAFARANMQTHLPTQIVRHDASFARPSSDYPF